MKLAFSTLGCPGWSFNEIFATAKDLGLDGIEIRGLGNQMYVPKAAEFNAQNIDKTKEFLRKTGLSISMLTSDAAFDDKKTLEANIKEAKEYVDLAVRLNCKYVRVLGEEQYILKAILTWALQKKDIQRCLIMQKTRMYFL